MSQIVLALHSASLSAKTGIEWTAVEELRSHIGIKAICVIWCIDSCVAEINWLVVAWERYQRVIHIPIRPSDHLLELVVSSALVVGISSINRASPPDTL